MRYDKGHKEATRHRIMEVAGTEFRRRGIDGIGVADVMKEAGLTHGGFYSHFSSKEELVREALGATFQQSQVRFPKNGETFKNLEEIVRYYLRTSHRDHPERGCVAAALAAEVARQPMETRTAFTSALNKVISVLESKLPRTKSPAARRKTARAIFATLMGTMQLARAIDDPEESDAMIEAGIEAACALGKI